MKKQNKQVEKNPWITATVVLGIMLLTIIIYQTVTDRIEDSKLLKITDNIEISSENLCYFYEEFGLNKDFQLCNMKNNHCVEMKLLQNPCEEKE